MNERDMFEKLLKEAEQEEAELRILFEAEPSFDNRIDEIILQSRYRMAKMKVKAYEEKLKELSNAEEAVK
ncbi:MAG TPA: hypothetical protein VK190_02720 [Pseudoneobacillus sp.]|nr:hypothetical protein [Pseudoneobacillus sp.]